MTSVSGFTLGSLKILTDVRNSLRPDRNLLHYIIEFIENKHSDLARLKRELESVYQAARHRYHFTQVHPKNSLLIQPMTEMIFKSFGHSITSIVL